MSEDYLAQKPVAMWNSARGVWEKPETVNLLCEHLELFSESWMTSGTMRNGVVFELPMQERPTSDSGFLSLPTPTVSNHNESGTCRDWGSDLTHALTCNCKKPLLPTPNTMDDLPARDESKIDRSKGGFSNVRETVMRPNFDRFEPAVKRWEQVTGMEAPAPTEPDGKDGAHRLSSKFTEWMMGLQPGWVTGHGLSRKDELKACGNGVVPQQAELALRLLMKGIEDE